MKCLLIGLLLLGAGKVASAQAPTPPAADAQPFKGANIILIATLDSAREAIRNMKHILRVQGLELDSLGTDRLTTKGMAVAAASPSATPTIQVFRVRAAATTWGTVLVITGEYAQDLGPKFHFTFPMRWLAPQNPSDNQACFLRAEKIAKAYPRGVVNYAQRPAH